MTFQLIAIMTHPSFDCPVTHRLEFTGRDFDDVLDQIETLPEHKYNLKHYRKTAFKDARGVKHKWKLEQVETLN